MRAIDGQPIITRWAKDAGSVCAGLATSAQFGVRRWSCLLVAAGCLGLVGCQQPKKEAVRQEPPARVLVVAPVLNLSGSNDFDPLKVTDLIVSEFNSFPGIAVVPLNLTLAELQRHGKYAVESSADAVGLARILGAEATVVIAVNEYSSYDPPIVGLTLQLYAANPPGGDGNTGPQEQVQRVYNAANEHVLEGVRHYAARFDGHESPYGWRKYVRSQELYVRYCGWAAIRTMLRLEDDRSAVVEPNEAHS